MYKPVKELIGKATQTLDNPPIARAFRNEIDPELYWTRDGQGQYSLVSPTDKLTNVTGFMVLSNGDVIRTNTQNAPHSISFETLDISLTAQDGMIQDASFYVQVWEDEGELMPITAP